MTADVKILLSEEQIAKRVQELAQEIDSYYKNNGIEEFLAVCILKGSCIFSSDLIRHIKTDVKLDFLQVASYNGSVTTGKVEFVKDLGTEVAGKHLLLIEDIIDTGNTLNMVIEKLWKREPAGILVCSLLDKPARRVVKLKGDFVGFNIPDKFAIGYGLDYNEQYRNLPYVGILELDKDQQ